MAYDAGYVIAVCPTLIEIHSARTGELVQLMRYQRVRLLTSYYAAPARTTDANGVIILDRVRTQTSESTVIRALIPRSTTVL